MGTDPQGIVGQRRCFCLICWADWEGKGQIQAAFAHLARMHHVRQPRRGLDWQAGSRWAAGKRPGGRPLKIECRRRAAAAPAEDKKRFNPWQASRG